MQILLSGLRVADSLRQRVHDMCSANIAWQSIPLGQILHVNNINAHALNRYGNLLEVKESELVTRLRATPDSERM